MFPSFPRGEANRTQDHYGGERHEPRAVAGNVWLEEGFFQVLPAIASFWPVKDRESSGYVLRNGKQQLYIISDSDELTRFIC